MSADFIAAVLEYPKNIDEPDWDAAYNLINNMGDFDLCANIICALNIDIYIPTKSELESYKERGDNYDIVSMLSDELEQFYHFNGGPRVYARKCIDEIDNMWHGDARGGTIELSNSVILISASQSYGDLVEGTAWINVFVELGAAKASGAINV